MNTKLLRKVKNHILKYPKAFDMDTFVETVEFDKEHICGTTACIAGWTCILEKDKLAQPVKFELMNNITQPDVHYVFDWKNTARKLLGLRESKSNKLFFVAEWPDEYMEAYCNSNNAIDRAKIAANRIEHFIKTGA